MRIVSEANGQIDDRACHRWPRRIGNDAGPRSVRLRSGAVTVWDRTCCGSPGDDTMAGMNVRRLAAIDMYGARGATRRRRIILAEFIAGAVVMVAFGVWLAAFSSGLAGRVLGLWMAGSGLNYVPLAAYAITLSWSGALDAELAGVDTGRELRRYSVLQLWIFVPLSLVVLAVRSAFSRRA